MLGMNDYLTSGGDIKVHRTKAGTMKKVKER